MYCKLLLCIFIIIIMAVKLSFSEAFTNECNIFDHARHDLLIKALNSSKKYYIKI